MALLGESIRKTQIEHVYLLQNKNLCSQNDGQTNQASTHHRGAVCSRDARDRRRTNGHAAPASRRRRTARTAARVAGRSRRVGWLACRAGDNTASTIRTLGHSDGGDRLDNGLNAGSSRVGSLNDGSTGRRLSNVGVLRELDTGGSNRGAGSCRRHGAHSGVQGNRLGRDLVRRAVGDVRSTRCDGVDSGRVHSAGGPGLGSLRGRRRRGHRGSSLGCLADGADGGVQSNSLRGHIASGWAVGHVGRALGNGVHRRGVNNACREGNSRRASRSS